MSRVYRIDVEVGHMSGCQLPAEAAGAIVSVYVGAHTLRDAMDRAEQELANDRYRPIDTTGAYELDLEREDYDTDEKGYPGNADLAKLKEELGLWYGPFYTFPHEDDEEPEDTKSGELIR